MVYRELQLSEGHTHTEAARLAALLTEPQGDVVALRGAVDALIADPDTSPELLDAIRSALMEGLANQLAVSQPRFNPALDIERP